MICSDVIYASHVQKWSHWVLEDKLADAIDLSVLNHLCPLLFWRGGAII